jgi:hypothetical protein
MTGNIVFLGFALPPGSGPSLPASAAASAFISPTAARPVPASR